MPETHEVNCAAFCRNLSDSVAKRMGEAGLALTASIGFETFHRPPSDVLHALQLADEAMYSVKERVGENALRLSSERSSSWLASIP